MDRFLLDIALFCKNSSRVNIHLIFFSLSFIIVDKYIFFIFKISKAEVLFRKVLLMLEDSDSANKALCLLLYGRMLRDIPDRTREGESILLNKILIKDF